MWWRGRKASNFAQERNRLSARTFFVTPTIVINAPAVPVISNTIIVTSQSVCFDYVHANAGTSKMKNLYRFARRGGPESPLHHVHVCIYRRWMFIWSANRLGRKIVFPKAENCSLPRQLNTVKNHFPPHLVTSKTELSAHARQERVFARRVLYARV